MPRPDNVGVGVAIIVWYKAEVLLGLRKGAHAAGLWSAPGGWIDPGDTSVQLTCQRELQEEIGIKIDITEIYPLNPTIEYHKELNVTCVTCYHETFLPFDLKDQIKLMEPNKCEEWHWFPIDKLPDNIFPNLKEQLESRSW